MSHILETLNETLEAQRAMTADYIVDADTMQMVHAQIELKLPSKPMLYTPTKVGNEHLATKLKIPAQYYERMRQLQPELLDENVNTWLRNSNENYFIRTFEDVTGNKFRAMLSEHYKVMDNYDVFHAFMSTLYETKQPVEVVQASTTDTRMYVKVVSRVEADASELLLHYRNPITGTRSVTARMGIEMTNSEVGKGAFQLMPFLYFNCCTNKLKIASGKLRKIHLGASMQYEEDMEWSQRTNQLTEQLIVSQVRDCVSKYMTEEYLKNCIAIFTEAAEHKLRHPADAVRNTLKLSGYSEERKEAVLDYFIQGGDGSAFGILQALTFEAQQHEDADTVYDAENFAAVIAPKVISFDKKFSAN